MKLAVLCTGDELLKGSTVNTNLAHIGAKLLEIGVVPRFAAEISDKPEDILAALEQAFLHADFILLSGGLGPTADDITKETVARRLGRRLEPDGEVTVNIMRFWKMRHPSQEIPPRVLNQSLVPDGAEVIANRNGTAPGLVLRTPDGKTVILLPGPPGELEPMFDTDVLPRIREANSERLHAKLFRVTNLGESEVEDRMLPVIARRHPLNVAYCASPGIVRLFLTSPDPDTLGDAIADVRAIFAEELLSDDSPTLAAEVVRMLRKRHARLATAESCTGGLVSKLITDIPGCSDVFLGGVVSYANEIKERLLGVSGDTLAEFGAVSPQTAEEMVNGLAERFGCDAAISLTGVAGPDGGTPEKPVGLVYAGIRWMGKTEVHELRLRRSREQIRERAAACALNLLRKQILAHDAEKA